MPIKTSANPVPTEYQEQKALIEWASYYPYHNGNKIRDYLIHIPNGGTRDIAEAKRLKDIGVKAGVSDLFLAIPRWGYTGLWLEMKRRNGAKVTIAQQEWLDKMDDIGYKAAVCHGWEEGRDIILEYLNPGP